MAEVAKAHDEVAGLAAKLPLEFSNYAETRLVWWRPRVASMNGAWRTINKVTGIYRFALRYRQRLQQYTLACLSPTRLCGFEVWAKGLANITVI